MPWKSMTTRSASARKAVVVAVEAVAVTGAAAAAVTGAAAAAVHAAVAETQKAQP
jgi:hypothetical protein